MLFSRNKVRALAAQNAVEFSKITEDLKRDIAAADACTDVGDQYLAYAEIVDRALRCQQDADNKIYHQLNNATSSGGWSLDVILWRPYKKILTADTQDFFVFLTGTAQEMSVKKDSLAESQMSALAVSARFGDICDKFPTVGSAFAKAVAKDGHDVPRVIQLNKIVPKQ